MDGDQASASVDANTVDQLTDQATSSGSGSVTVAVKAPSDVSQVAVSLPASAVADLADKTDAALNIETPVASVTIPNDSLAELSTGSQALSVTAAKNENNTVSITVAKDGETVDKVSGGLKATIPLEESTPGTVAVLVNPDGTETIIKKSIASDGSVSLPLDGSAEQTVADLVRRRLLTPEQAQAVDTAALQRFVASPLAAELRKADRVEREFRFSLLASARDYYPQLGAEDEVLLQGVVDLFAVKDGKITVVDFKTDYVTSKTLRSKAEYYRPQLEAYSTALEKIWELPVVRRVLYFFHTGEAVEV